MRHTRAKGVTLVEMMIALTIFMVISGVMMGMYLAGQDVWGSASTISELQGEARNALQFMVGELQQATRTAAGSPPNAWINPPILHFYLPLKDAGKVRVVNRQVVWDTANLVDYQYDAGQRRLVRVSSGDTRILAHDVEDVTVSDITSEATLALNEIKIILTLRKPAENNRPQEVSMTSVVRLRN